VASLAGDRGVASGVGYLSFAKALDLPVAELSSQTSGVI
jgi:hypothetical protein